jgi:enoyl-CoA hydratase/carnithine racemase
MHLEPTHFKFELQKGVGVITLNRPNRLNALTFDVYQELADFFVKLDQATAVRSIVITGAGRAFCSGGDVEDIIAELFSRDMQGLLSFTRLTGRLIQNICQVRKPVIAAIQGVAVGAGAVISAASDIRIASDRARFGFIFPQVGLCGADMGAAYLLPRIVGQGHATELLLTGDIFNADRALEIGFINHKVTVEECLPKAMELAHKIAKGPAFAHQMTKTMLNSESHMTLAQAIEAEAQAQAICMSHPDFLEAHHAWKEKRDPQFEGSPY